MTAPPLLAILLVTSSDLTSPNRHLLFHYPPHPSLDSVADEENPDDSSSDTESLSSSTSTSSTTSVPSSKYSRITGENNRYTIDEDEDHHENLDMEEDVDRTPWRRTVLTEWEQPIFGLTKRDLADILIPKDALCNRKFELGVEDVVFLGHPVYLNDIPNGRQESQMLATSPSSSITDDTDIDVIVNKVKLSKFHIVFAMNPSWREDYLEQVQKMYNEIIKKFTDACVVEQLERGYISLEAAKINKTIREAEEKELPMSMVWEDLMATSNLAHAISTLYNSIIHNKVAFIDLNNSVELAFHIKQISQISSLPESGTTPFGEHNVPLLSTAHGFGEREEEADQVLAPKYTLLFLYEPDEILTMVPHRAPHRAQNWAKFLTLKPTETFIHLTAKANGRFRHLARDKNLPLYVIMTMARELISLDLARAMPPLSNRAAYYISPIAPIAYLPSQARAFKTRFPNAPDLGTILATISAGQPRRWDSIVLQLNLPQDVLPYLMRTGWLTQLRQFYFIRIPREIKLECIEATTAEERRRAQESAEDTILLDPYRASREEVRWIRRLAEKIGGGGGGFGRTFERLAKYLDGKSAKEKILRREQVGRRELEAMFEAVENVGGLIVAEHW